MSRIHDKKTHLDTLKKYQAIFEKGLKSTSVIESFSSGNS